MEVGDKQPAARKPGQIIDTKGRVLEFKRISPLDQMRLAKIVGAEDSRNEMVMGFAAAAVALQSINGEAMLPVSTMGEIEFIVERMGEEGIEAAGRFFAEVKAGKAGEAEIVASAKNS